MLTIRYIYLHLFFRCNNTKHIIYLACPTIKNTVHVFMHKFSCDSITLHIPVDLSCGIISLFISIEMMHDGVVCLKWKMGIC